MNGQEQKERQTAVAKLERQVEKMSQDFHDLWSAELDARVKSEEHLKEMFASMLDAETQFRKQAIQRAVTGSSELHNSVAQAYLSFVQLRWWKRWGWCIFGHIFLIWISDPKTRESYYANRRADKLARAARAKETLAATGAMTPENELKQRAYSERPQ